jgi:hypothetical protein
MARIPLCLLVVAIAVQSAAAVRKPLGGANDTVVAQDYDYNVQSSGGDCTAWEMRNRRWYRFVGAPRALIRTKTIYGTRMTLVRCTQLCRQWFGEDAADGTGALTGPYTGVDNAGDEVDPCFSFNYHPSTRTCTLYGISYEYLDSRSDKK